jgi:hypothetical protein
MSVSRRQSSRIAGLVPAVSADSSAAAADAPSAPAAAAEEKRRQREASVARGIATKAAKRLAAARVNFLAADAAAAAAAAAAGLDEEVVLATGGLVVGPTASRDADAEATRLELAETKRLVRDLMARLSAAPPAAPAASAAAAPLAAASQTFRPSSGPRLNKPLEDHYKGESGEALDAWIEATTQLRKFYHDLSPAEAVRWLATGLKGPALKWYNQRYPGAPPGSAEELYKEIRLRFQPIDSVETARRELRGLRQGKSSVDAYASRFLELKGQLPRDEMSDEALTSNFRAGLQAAVEDHLLAAEPQPVDLAATMRLAARFATRRAGAASRSENAANAELEDRPATLAEINALMEKVRQSGAAAAGAGGRPRASQGFETRRDRGANSRSRAMPIWKEVGLTETEGARRHATGACMWCAQTGHMMRECTQKQQGKPARLN